MDDLKAGPDSPVWASIGIDYPVLLQRIHDALGGTDGNTPSDSQQYQSPRGGEQDAGDSMGDRSAALGHRTSDAPSSGVDGGLGAPLGSRQSSDTQTVRGIVYDDGGVLRVLHAIAAKHRSKHICCGCCLHNLAMSHRKLLQT